MNQIFNILNKIDQVNSLNSSTPILYLPQYYLSIKHYLYQYSLKNKLINSINQILKNILI